MIIIKITILYFIQITHTHTDDSPSTGIRLVVSNVQCSTGQDRAI